MALGTALYAMLAASTGTTKYVTTTGSDSTGDGSIGNPWASFQKLLDNLTPGQKGKMGPGIYNAPTGSAHTLANGHSGTALNPIEIYADPGDIVRIRPAVVSPHEALVISSGATASCFWRFRNLIFELAGTGSNYQNIYIAGVTAGSAPTDIEFWNCEARLAQQGTGVFCEEGTRRIHFINCKVHDNYDTVVAGTQRQGIYVTGDNCMMLNTLVYNHEGFGFQIRHNPVGDSDGPKDCIIANCVAYNNLGIVNPGTEFAGFFTEEAADNVQFRNNISYGNRNGFRGLVGPGGTPTPHNQAVWNIANGNVNTQFGRQSTSDALDYTLAASGDYVGPGDNLTSDPKLIDPANANFHLQAGSPAIGYGDEAYCPTFDHDNVVRLACDAGAYVYVSPNPRHFAWHYQGE